MKEVVGVSVEIAFHVQIVITGGPGGWWRVAPAPPLPRLLRLISRQHSSASKYPVNCVANVTRENKSRNKYKTMHQFFQLKSKFTKKKKY